MLADATDGRRSAEPVGTEAIPSRRSCSDRGSRPDLTGLLRGATTAAGWADGRTGSIRAPHRHVLRQLQLCGAQLPVDDELLVPLPG
jgi:hypothetical protein